MFLFESPLKKQVPDTGKKVMFVANTETKGKTLVTNQPLEITDKLVEYAKAKITYLLESKKLSITDEKQTVESDTAYNKKQITIEELNKKLDNMLDKYNLRDNFNTWLQQQNKNVTVTPGEQIQNFVGQQVMQEMQNRDQNAANDRIMDIAEAYKAAWFEYATSVLGTPPKLDDNDVKELGEKGEVKKDGFKIKVDTSVGKPKVSISKIDS